MSRPQPWQWAGGVLLVAVLGLLMYGFWPQLTGAADEAGPERPESEGSSRRANVDVQIIEPRDFVLRAEATGHLRPWRATKVSAEASGRVVARPHEEGDFVRQGTVLLQMDFREQEIALAEAESELLKAQSEFATFTAFRSDVEVDSSAVRIAREQFANAVQAREEGQITERELTQARRTLDIALLRAGNRRSEVEAVVSGLAQAESRAARARLNLERMQVVAPFSGFIADIEVEVGQRIGAGQELLQLLQTSRMRVQVDVLESDLARISRGGTARVRIPALDDEVVQGRVHAINPSVDPDKGTGRITVALDNSSGRLVSGLFAYVELEAGRLADRVVVPTEALLVRQGRDLVFLVDGGRAKWTYVTVGRRSGDAVEIVEPLVAGDSLAVSGHHALSHDAAVRVEKVVAHAQ
ncbi:MAG: efflux RND transporter periplasmic adaptor subunit [Rhodothermales bacterium]|nr:efflux RND transporter periplasmic adaptor subunit [Rhodothermales bacterium]MBO6779054.1 efflux RND transporter periplasmic adaptor subunit [Rhodothermales bacterium]